MTRLAEAPWVSDPFGLVSPKEIIATMTDSTEWPSDEIILGPLANALYGIGRLEMGRLSAKDVIGVSFFLKNAADSLSGWGFAATAGAFRDLAELSEGHVIQGANPLHGPEQIPVFAAAARQSLMHELQARVFLPVDPSAARYYREPRRDWEEVIERFPDTVMSLTRSPGHLA